jgi:hypothetical protein
MAVYSGGPTEDETDSNFVSYCPDIKLIPVGYIEKNINILYFFFVIVVDLV